MAPLLAPLLAVAACSNGGDAANNTVTQTAVSETEEADALTAAAPIRLYAFDCGQIVMKELSMFTQGDEYDGRTNNAITMCFLVRHPKGDLMWDAGLPQGLHEEEGGVDNGAFHVSVPITIASQLDAIGVSADEIEYFSISHSHFDHLGDANRFSGSTFLVDGDERAHMFNDEARENAQNFASYNALEAAETIEFEGDYDVFGDGAVTILDTPGHTPGHKSLRLQLANAGLVLLTGDLYHLAEARERRLVPKFNTDVEQTLASMDRFEQIAEATNARVIIQHVMADYEALPHAPDYLD